MNQTNATYVPLAWVKVGKMTLAATLCPIGIISSVLAICSLWKKLITKKSMFFILMTLVSFFDLLFNCAYIVIKWGDNETWFYAICHALCFTASYASDLCSLVLTAERYVKIRFPHTKLSKRDRKIVYGLIGIIVGLISASRLRYMSADKAVIRVTPPWFTTYFNSISAYIGFVSDTGLPFLGIVLMAFFSSKIAQTVVKRARKRKVVVPVLPQTSAVQPPSGMPWTSPSLHAMAGSSIGGNIEPMSDSRAANQSITDHRSINQLPHIEQPGAQAAQQQQRQAKEERLTATLSLILVLDLLFLLNQVGYCISSSAFFYSIACGNCQAGNSALSIGSFVCDIAECISHSLNFYFYLRFSTLIQIEFRQFWSKMKARLNMTS